MKRYYIKKKKQVPVNLSIVDILLWLHWCLGIQKLHHRMYFKYYYLLASYCLLARPQWRSNDFVIGRWG